MISISGESLVVINAIKLVDYFHGHSLEEGYDVLPRHHLGFPNHSMVTPVTFFLDQSLAVSFLIIRRDCYLVWLHSYCRLTQIMCSLI